MSVFSAAPDADLEHALGEWRRFRRQQRTADVHWVDALYKAYLTALLAVVGAFVVAGAIGDSPLGGAELDDVRAQGAAWLGVAAAAVFAIGLRSGSRGGPLALERAEVRHVLMAPVDRTTALRGPVLRQLRFLLFVAAIVGAASGELAGRRLPVSSAGLILGGTLYAIAAVAGAYGAALAVSALRVRSWAATVVALAVVAWSIGDAVGWVGWAPFTAVGTIGLWALSFEPVGLAAVAVAGVMLAGGLVRVGDLSVEAAERRSRLVGQLRFAATLQDLRTVLVLRRQLAMELPRLRPWARSRRQGPGRWPVWSRGLRGVARWPAARLARLVILAVVAGLSARAAWAGTTPMLAVAGIALFLAALDAVEPLAQEIDHPTRLDSAPVESGYVHLRHVPLPVTAMVVVAAMGAGVAVAVEPSAGAVGVAAVAVVPAALGAVSGALASVLGGGPANMGSGSWSVLPPEVAGIRLAFRSIWPPALAVVGVLPVLAGRAAHESGRPPAGAAGAAAIGVVVLFALTAGWARQRENLHRWWTEQMDAAMNARESKTGSTDDGP
ncbi:MAG: hypothetical protein ACT4PW_01095 [Acidimicrobiia bacterium]